MSQGALFIRHKALPGKRDAVRAIWAKYARAYVEEMPGQLAYFYGDDAADPDAVLVFQLHEGDDAGADFVKQSWFPAYEAETRALLAEPSIFRNAGPRFVKGMGR
jgi:Uncharacterized conserved protein